jgi:hypothetical protein
MLFVYNNSRFLFIHIGGTGGTSVEYYFSIIYTKPVLELQVTKYDFLIS